MYFDNNATTALAPEVLAVMLEELQKGPSNASSIHSYGQSARGRLAAARHTVASYFGVAPKEVIFTSGATEALNHVIKGLGNGKRILSSELEHAAVLTPLHNRPLVTLLKGAVTLEKMADHLPHSDLLIFMAANNETGVKTDLAALADVAYQRGIPLIVDGVALIGKEPFTFHRGITALVFSAHKFHGPLGAGCLILNKNCPPFIEGGPQENRRRAGTENLPAICGLAKALTLDKKTEQIGQRRDYFEELLQELDIEVNGEGERLCNTSNLYFPGVEGEELMIHLDQVGLCCSHGSACSSGTLAISRVLLSLGYPRERAKSSLRFSFSRFTTPEEIERGADLIKETVKKLRR